jgi:hypothetical protein
MKRTILATVLACSAISRSVVNSAAQSAPLPPDDVLQAKVLEVGRAMGLTETYHDPVEGLFVWRVKVSVGPPEKPAAECNALFLWHLKRIDNRVALNDPLILPSCDPQQQAALLPKIRPIQLEFVRRWRAAVGDVTIVGPTAQTHSQALEGLVLALLSKESGSRASPQLPTGPDALTWRPLREINAEVLVPDGWFLKRVIPNGQAAAAVAYFITLENIDALGKFDTGLSLNVLLARSRSGDVDATAKAMIAGACAAGTNLRPQTDITEGVFHRYGCLLRVQGKEGSQVDDHRLILNTTTKTVYLLDFESPEDRWEKAWTTGATIVEMLSLDEKV